jgi:PIN domain nuclease of toxin-antitoxin system
VLDLRVDHGPQRSVLQVHELRHDERLRVSAGTGPGHWLDAAAHPRSVQLLPLSPRIAAELASLPDTFPRDPADRIIVACSRALRIPVLTHDTRIRRSRLVTLWGA